MMATSPRPSLRVPLAIALVSAGTLALEVSLARIFAFSLWQHFASLVISLALLGFGASGTFLTWTAGGRWGDARRLWTLGLAFGLTAIGGYCLSQQIPLDPYLLVWEPEQALGLLGFYLTLGVPFFAAGLLVGGALRDHPEQAPLLYGANLLGAAAGCLVAIAAPPRIGGPGMIPLSAAFGFLAAAVAGPRSPRWKSPAAGLLAVGALLLAGHGDRLPLRLSAYKALSLALRAPGARILQTGWSALSRVDVFESPAFRHAPGLSFQFPGRLPAQVGLTVDGDGPSALTRFAGDPDSLAFTDYLTSALPFHLRPAPRVLVVGPGGGADVLAAIYHRSRAVTAVELDPLVVRTVREDFADYTGGLYRRPDVRVLVGDGRSYVRRTSERFDIIQISLLDSLAAAAAGLLSGREATLYTVEAFRDFARRLAPGGVLSITRWLRSPPRDSIRAFAIAARALEADGIAEPGRHLAFIRGWATGTILLRRDPFSPADLAAIRRFSDQRGFDLVYLPDLEASERNRFNRLREPLYAILAAALLDPARRPALFASYPFDITAVTDDRPFFFDTLKLRRLPELLRTVGRGSLPLLEWGSLVGVAALVQAAVLGGLLILVPLGRLPKRPGVSRAAVLVYFGGLGIGFMLIELTLLQRFVLFLGHPIYALSMILFSILALAGAGSLLAGRPAVDRRLPGPALAVAGLALAYAALLPPLLSLLTPLPATGRLLTTPFLIAPLALGMGIPFPAGMRALRNPPDRLGDDSSPAGRRGDRSALIGWGWGINGCASVVGALVAPLAAASWGFTSVLILAAGCYTVAGMAAWRLGHR